MGARVEVKKKGGLGPPQKIPDEGEVLQQFIERLRNEVKLPEVYTLIGLAAKLKEILQDVNHAITWREIQKWNNRGRGM